jgi:hypothetical protein
MAKRYRLTAEPHRERDEFNNHVLRRVRFTASESGETHVIDLDVPEQGIDGTLIVLMAGASPETGIRATQALKRGENVNLGSYDAAGLAVLGFEGLEPQH